MNDGIMRDRPTAESVCEQHPWLEWPHDDCVGPGMSWFWTIAMLVARIEDLEAERDRLRRVLEAERDEHDGGKDDWCVECGYTYPCDASRRLDAALREDTDE